MKRAMMSGVAALAVFGFVSMGCFNDETTSGSAGNGGSGGSGGSGGASSGGASGGSSTSSNGGSGGGSGGASSGGASGGSSTSSSGGSGGSTSSGSCGTTDGTYEEDTTFGTEGKTAPYTLNKWGTWGKETLPTLTQTTTGPDGLDCSSGCAKLTIDFSDGTGQYSAGSFVEYFGTTSDSVENLLNETITVEIAVDVEQASGADKAVPIDINLFGQDTYVSTLGVDNLWVKKLNDGSSLDAADGWHTETFKVVDAKVPSWSPTRTVCASALHAMGITIQNNAVIDGSNGAVVSLYVKRVSVGSGGTSGSGGSGGGGGGAGGSGGGGGGGDGGGGGGGGDGGSGGGGDGGSGGGGGDGGSGGDGSGGSGGGGGDGSGGTGGGGGDGGSGGSGGDSGGAGGGSGGAGGGSGGAGGGGGGAGGGGSSGAGGSGGASAECGTTDGTYEENTTFGTADSTAPYNLNEWSWGDKTKPTLTQTTTGPEGLDCGSGCAKLTIDFSDGTAQYSAGSFVEYFGENADSVKNLLNETITAKIAVEVAQADGATAAVPITITLFGQDTYESTSGTDNLWVKDLGSASALEAASGWHTVTHEVTDARVPSWSPTRTVCASALHAMGITIQNTAAIDGTNGAVVTLYVQSVAVSPP